MAVELSIENEFPCAPDLLWDLFASAEFDRRLEAASGIRYEEVDAWTEGDVEVRKVKCTSLKELPGFVARVLGTRSLTYDQLNRLNRSTQELAWEVVLPVLTDKITAAGVTTAIPTPTGTRRRVRGTFQVKIPVVGGRIEKTLLEQVERSYQRAAEVALGLLAEGFDPRS